AAELPVSPPSPAAGSVAMWPPLCGGEGFWLVSFLDSLRVELAGKRLACCEIVEAGQVPSPNATVHLKIELLPCTPDADRVRVLVSEPARAATAEREIGLADVKETARPRALALAVAELLRSLGQSASAAKAEAPPAAAETGTGAPPVESRRAAALSVHVDAEVRGFPTRDTLLWGGRAGFAAGWGWLHARLDAGGGFASARVDSGDVLLRTLSAGLGVGPRFAARSAILDLGLRAELGWIWVRGESGMAFVRTGAGSDFCATAALRASVEAPARVRARPRVTLEGGGVLRGVKAQANGVTVAGITGYYLLAAVGVAISL
ncbi:MAG: hypothetical protein JXP73_09665, partial [Deltaproteobacteria bacterium]|nr:hypothetical protein [Deltaproteobacteria bacterium]